MNRALFIADFRELAKDCTGEELASKVADYVQRMPFNPGHRTVEELVNVSRVVDICCLRYNLSIDQMKASDRSAEIRHPRQVTMYMLVRRSSLSHKAIGDLFGRDRSTVTATRQRMDNIMTVDRSLREEIEQLNSLI